MGLFPEDTDNFNYEANGYWCYNNITQGDITGARICIKQNRAIAISLEHGNTLGKCANSLKSCYSIAVKARSLYAGALGLNFPVSAKAMAWEIWLHAMPEALDKVINNRVVRAILGTNLSGQIATAASAIVASHTDYADIGVYDKLRSFDKYFEQAYDLIY